MWRCACIASMYMCTAVPFLLCLCFSLLFLLSAYTFESSRATSCPVFFSRRVSFPASFSSSHLGCKVGLSSPISNVSVARLVVCAHGRWSPQVWRPRPTRRTTGGCACGVSGYIAVIVLSVVVQSTFLVVKIFAHGCYLRQSKFGP